MNGYRGGGEDSPQPPPHLFERLAHLKGYTWDESIEPFYSASIQGRSEDHYTNPSPFRPTTTGMSSVRKTLVAMSQVHPQRMVQVGARPGRLHGQRRGTMIRAAVLEPPIVCRRRQRRKTRLVGRSSQEFLPAPSDSNANSTFADPSSRLQTQIAIIPYDH